MDEMNPLEKQLQSWTPRRPSPKIARRLFGPAEKPLSRNAWNWLSPVAACALTMLLAVHSANRAPARLAQDSNTTLFASLMLDIAVTSNIANVSFSGMDENVEWNVFPLPTFHGGASPVENRRF